MQLRLMLLWGACLALVLSIGSCGGDPTDFKPVNKTGALDSGAPDVILFVLNDAQQDAKHSWRQALDTASAKGGVVFNAAYARFPNPEKARLDLLGLGRVVAQGESVDWPLESPLFVGLRNGGYETRVLAAKGLADFLAEVSRSPRFALVELTSGSDKAAALATLQAVTQAPQRALLTTWTALPLAGQGAVLTEEQLHVPLVFAMPGTLSKDHVHTQVVSLADVGVTLLDLCGLLPEGAAQNEHEGASFARILQKKPLVWRGYVLAKAAGGQGWIRSMRWRLVRQAGGQDTLTYVEEDPTSTRDDSGLTGAPAQRAGLGKRLSLWLK